MTKKKKNPDKSFSHLEETGDVNMVDITDKPLIERKAVATGFIKMNPETIRTLSDEKLPKGNVLTTAKLAGIQASKKTAELIPLCHQLQVSWIDIRFNTEKDGIHISAEAKAKESTGLEMEVLTAVSVAALTIYDMCKAVDKSMAISDIQLTEKKGGKSDYKTHFNPRTAILVLSQSVFEGKSEDTSGQILEKGLKDAGCKIEHQEVIPDDEKKLKQVVEKLVKDGVELIFTSGGTGVGPYDITTDTIEPLLTQRLPGVEQALHAYGRNKLPMAMLSRLLAGRIEKTFVICIPGSPGAARDAIAVLMPHFFHVYFMTKGESH